MLILGYSFRHGNAERVYGLEFVSNSEYTESEFNKWRETMMLAGMTLPTTQEIDNKLKDINDAVNYHFKEDDVDKVSIYNIPLSVCWIVYFL